MKNIAAGDARAFERFIAEEGHAFPPELQAKAQSALLMYRMMVGQEKEFAQSAAIRADAARILMEFAQAYGAWRATWIG